MTAAAILNDKGPLVGGSSGFAVALLGAAFLGGFLYWYEHIDGREYLLGVAATGVPGGRRVARGPAVLLLALWYASSFGVSIWRAAPWRHKRAQFGAWVHATASASAYATVVMGVTSAIIGMYVGIRRLVWGKRQADDP